MPHRDDHPLGVDVPQLEGQGPAYAQPGGVQQDRHRSVLEIRDRVQEPNHLGLAQHDRGSPRLAWIRDLGHEIRAPEGEPIEKPQRPDRLGEGRAGDPPLYEEVAKVFADLVPRQGGGRTAEVSRHLGDAHEVRRLRLRRVVPNLQVRPHLPE